MKIIKYAGKSCVKCKALDRILEQVDLPCAVDVRYVEDFGQDSPEFSEITTMPTLKFIGDNNNSVTLTGMQSPNAIKEAILQVQG